MGKRRTHEEFIAEMDIVNPNIEIIGYFVNMRTKIKCRCKIDGYEWNATPDNLLRGHGCSKCAGCVKRTHNQFVAEMAVLNQNIEITTSYINVDTIIGCRCKICYHEWYATPNNLLSGKGCKMCGYDALSQQHMNNPEKYLLETKEKVDVTFLSGYLGTTERIKVKCNKCGYEWSPICKHLHNGIGCPRCNSSNGESLIQKYLEEHNIEYEFQKKFDDLVGINGRQLSYDFYIPNNFKWKKESMIACNYKCILTQERFDDIHHIYSLNLILNEVLELLNITIKPCIDDYSKDELQDILDLFIIIQDKYPLGVCLTKAVHTLFHNKYGYGNNTQNQWNEFVKDYNNGKYFNELNIA